MEDGQNKKKNNWKIKLKVVFKIINSIFLIIVVMGSMLGVYMLSKFTPAYEKMSLEADKLVMSVNDDTFRKLDPTIIVRNDGTIVKEFKYAPYTYLESHEIPDDIKKAFVSMEDKNFYIHKGFDIKANLRAAKALIVNKGKITQGASTITQQLVKLTFLTNEQTYERKIKEIIIATKLEEQISKDKILEYYINSIYYGNGAYGIGAAAELYFSKDVNDLTLSEIAFLTSIPNNPTIYDPIKNKDNTLGRRNRMLEQMFLDNEISEEQLTKSKKEEITLNIKPKEKYVPEDYEITYIMSSAIKLIMEQEGFELKFKFKNDEERAEYNEAFQKKFEDVNERVRAGGYKIESTIDPVKQEQLQIAINEGLKDFTSIDKNKGIYETQGAAVTIDNKTNDLVAIIGGRTQENQDNTFNRAFLSYRQPGSIMKPIIAYGIEIEEGMLSSDKYVDKKYPKGPNNSNGRFRGEVSAREAMQRSINTIPFNILKERGTHLAHEYMSKMEFSKVVDDDKNAGIAIGGFTYGTTPLEIAGAFSTLANNGEYIRSTGIKNIRFKNLIIYENEKKAVKVYEDGTAYLLIDMLKGVLNEPWGTGRKSKLDTMPAAAKTGTTNENKDGWFSGFTPYYTTTVWVGNDLPKTIKGLYGSNYPGQIWKSYMTKIHEGLPVKDFKMPEGTKKMYLNPKTRDISEIPKRGYTNYEIIPKAYIDKIEMKRAELAKAKEEERKLQEEKELKRQKDFENRYGIKESEELKYRNNVSKDIKLALSMEINNEQDYNVALNLLDKAHEQLSSIVVIEYKNKLKNEIIEGHYILEERKEEMYIKQEEEIKKAKEELMEDELEESKPEEDEIIIEQDDTDKADAVDEDDNHKEDIDDISELIKEILEDIDNAYE